MRAGHCGILHPFPRGVDGTWRQRRIERPHLLLHDRRPAAAGSPAARMTTATRSPNSFARSGRYRYQRAARLPYMSRTSAATPTTCTSRPLLPVRSQRPTASPPGQSSAAMALPTTATGASLAYSCSLSSRPASQRQPDGREVSRRDAELDRGPAADRGAILAGDADVQVLRKPDGERRAIGQRRLLDAGDSPHPVDEIVEQAASTGSGRSRTPPGSARAPANARCRIPARTRPLFQKLRTKSSAAARNSVDPAIWRDHEHAAGSGSPAADHRSAAGSPARDRRGWPAARESAPA